MTSYFASIRSWYVFRLMRRALLLDAELIVHQAEEAQWRREITEQLRSEVN